MPAIFKVNCVMLLAMVASSIVVAADAPSSSRGREVFARVGCYQCHGYLGQGGIAGPRIAPDVNDLALFQGFLRTSNRGMPAYSKAILSDQELHDIYAYLKSVPRPPPVGKIPLLDAAP